MKTVLVLGGGPTGLTLALKLAEKGYGVTVLEKEKKVGGVSSSFSYSNCVLDYGPHKIYTQIPGVLEFIQGVLGEDLLEQPKKSKIRLFGKYFDYPVNVRQVLGGLKPSTTFSCGLSYGIATFKNKVVKDKGGTYESYLTSKFGATVYELIFKDFAWKVWGDPQKLSSDLAKARVSIPSLFEMVKRVVLGDGGEKEISAKVFYYPKHGNIELYEKIAEKITSLGGEVVLNAKVNELVTEDGRVKEVVAETLFGRTSFKADFVVSTLSLLSVASSMRPVIPVEVMNSFKQLKHRSMVLLYVVVDKDRLFDDSFIFYPESVKEFPFHRLSEQKAFSEFTVPKGKTVLCVEMIRDPEDALFDKTDKQIFECVLPSLEKTGFLIREEVLDFFTKRAHGVYPVYDLAYKKNLTDALAFLDGFNNFMTLGRRGLFNYNNQDHCMDMAFKASEFIDSLMYGKATWGEWLQTRLKFDEYVIVD
ncbi:MAG: FAD-dependent oxidoreductase [Candidatus Micrarchaeota archaeon]